MGLGWKDWSRSDVIYGVLAPLIVVLLIVVLYLVGFFLMRGGPMGNSSMGIVIGVINEIAELILTVAVPLLLGLVWNRWAGGASGFLMGNIYALWYAVKYNLYSAFFRGTVNLEPTLLGWVLSAMLIGYTAGALNKSSENLRRMVIAGVVSTTVGGVFLFWMFQLSPSNVVTGVVGFSITVLSRTACGVIMPLIAKVFMWYGLAMHSKTG